MCDTSVKPVPPAGSNQEAERITDLEAENEALRREISSLHKEIQELKQHGGGRGSGDGEVGGGTRGSLEHQLVQAQQELTRALEGVQGMLGTQ